MLPKEECNLDILLLQFLVFLLLVLQWPILSPLKKGASISTTDSNRFLLDRPLSSDQARKLRVGLLTPLSEARVLLGHLSVAWSSFRGHQS